MTHDALAILESVKVGDPVAWDEFINAAEQRHDQLLAESAWHEGQGEGSEEVIFFRRDDGTPV